MRRAVIYLDGSPNDKDSLSFALSFCERMSARLSVVLILEPEQMFPAPMDSFVAVIDNSAQREAHAALGRQAYRDMCAGKSFAEFSEATMGIADAIEAGGYLYDVTILERLTSSEGAEVVNFNAALFNSGAPVLINPPGGVVSAAERVALVWNDTVPRGARHPLVGADPQVRQERRRVHQCGQWAGKTAGCAALSLLSRHRCFGEELQSGPSHRAGTGPCRARSGERGGLRFHGHGRVRRKPYGGSTGPRPRDREGCHRMQNSAVGAGVIGLCDCLP